MCWPNECLQRRAVTVGAERAVLEPTRSCRVEGSPLKHRPLGGPISGKFGAHSAAATFGLCVVLAAVAFAACGCKRASRSNIANLTVKETIESYHGAPVGDSIDRIAEKLVQESVLVATDEPGVAQPGHLRLKTGTDNEGHPWVYMYTDKEEFHKTFPQGGAFVEMKFVDAFNVVASNDTFRGIVLNSGSKSSGETMYPIPRELFDRVRRFVEK